MGDKEALFKDIQEIKSDRLFITDSVDNLEEEVKNNCWSISMKKEIASACEVDEVIEFLRDVKADRREQLKKSEYKVGLIYYLWFDEQAGQLRFNFINSNHDRLPFAARLAFVDTENEIISDFLASSMTDGDELKVYKELIL